MAGTQPASLGATAPGARARCWPSAAARCPRALAAPPAALGCCTPFVPTAARAMPRTPAEAFCSPGARASRARSARASFSSCRRRRAASALPAAFLLLGRHLSAPWAPTLALARPPPPRRGTAPGTAGRRRARLCASRNSVASLVRSPPQGLAPRCLCRPRASRRPPASSRSRLLGRERTACERSWSRYPQPILHSIFSVCAAHCERAATELQRRCVLDLQHAASQWGFQQCRSQCAVPQLAAGRENYGWLSENALAIAGALRLWSGALQALPGSKQACVLTHNICSQR